MSRGEKSKAPFIVFSALSLVRQVVASRFLIASKTSANSLGCLVLRNFSPPLNEYVLIIFILFYEKIEWLFVEFCKFFQLQYIEPPLSRFNFGKIRLGFTKFLCNFNLAHASRVRRGCK